MRLFLIIQIPIVIIMEFFDENGLESIVADNGYGAIAGGPRRIQVSPDGLLKIFAIDPTNGLLDLGTDGSLQVRLHFNKSIDQWPDNLNRFLLLDQDLA